MESRDLVNSVKVEGKTAVSQIYGPRFVARKGKMVAARGLAVPCESDLPFDLMYPLY